MKLIFIFGTLCIAQIFGAAVEKDTKDKLEGKIPAGVYAIIGGKKYFIGKGYSSDKYYRNDALAECEALGMTLVSLETAQEYGDIYDYLYNDTEDYMADFWSSGKYDREEDVWNWNTTKGVSPYLYSNWGSYYPQYEDSPDCMSFSASDYYWSDKGCNLYKRSLFCED